MIGLLLVGGIGINFLENRGEVTPPRKNLAELPKSFSGWEQHGNDIKFSPQTESVLQATDYIDRFYLKYGRFADIYVGYYSSQKSGETYHSPQNCLPGAGWEMREPTRVQIHTPNGGSFEANKYIIENGEYKAVMIYWYQGRGRRTASEYYDKIYTVLDSVTRKRSDGSMVRVMTAVGDDEAEAERVSVEIAGALSDELTEFVPE